MHESLDERRKVELDDIDLHAQGREVLLDKYCHHLARLIPGIRDDGESDGMSGVVEQLPTVQPETCSLQ